MSKGIKLTYFDGKGRAEISRLILNAAGQKFEDERITFEAWGARKATAKFNCLPNLTYNGKVYGQSMAIAQFLAREFGFFGKNNEESLRVDEVVQILMDVRGQFMTLMFEKDEAKKAALMEKAKESFPKNLKFLEDLAVANGKKGFFVGTKLSLADILLFDSLDGIKMVCDPEAGKDYPEVVKVLNSVKSTPSIKKYLETRKVTQF